MGGYWNDLSDQYIGARAGYGAPGLEGERWYTMVDDQDFRTVDLMRYDVLLVQSGFTDDWVTSASERALEALGTRTSDLSSFLAAGRGLVAMAQPLPDGVIHDWTWSPVSLASHGVWHENLVEVTGAGHPAMRGQSSESLSGWQSSWHGWFESWDPSLQVIARTGDYGDGDPRTGRPVTLASDPAAVGGRLFFSLQDPDYHAYQGVEGAKGMMQGALDWAGTRPVTEPRSGLLLLAGVAALAWPALRSRMRGAKRRAGCASGSPGPAAGVRTDRPVSLEW